MGIVDKHLEALKKLCKNYNVDQLYLFGSALNAAFNKDSDVDFLVKFKNIDLAIYFEFNVVVKEKLEDLFGRKVDLVEEQTLKNPILIRSINNNKALIYG